jgi:glycosyltransferase involved in cell wall biosynthesis
MKIVFFNFMPLEQGGGLAKYYTEISKNLSGLYPDLEITLASLSDKLAKRFQTLYSAYFLSKGVVTQTQSYPSFVKGISPVRYKRAQSFRELRHIFASQDVIYCKNDVLELTLLRLFTNFQSQSGVVIGFHTPIYYEKTFSFRDTLHNSLYNNPLYNNTLSSASAFHVVNTFDKELLSKRFPLKLTQLIYNPFSFSEFREQIQSGMYKIKTSKRKKIAWIGRLTEEKGIKDLLDIVSQMSSLEKAVEWIIIGSGPYQKKIEALANQHDNIQYYQYIPNQSIASVLSQADVFLSTSHFECFPYTFLEAQSVGLPIVTYDIHGCNDIVDGQNGYLAKNSGDVLRGIRTELGKAGDKRKEFIKKYISKKFDEKKSYRDMYQLLTSL